MNRAGKKLGKLTYGGPEDRRFRSFFGCGVKVFLTAWNLMVDAEVIPPEGCFYHYFWALLFMKLYPKNETELCGLLGGIDPKTMRKWVWPFIRALAELDLLIILFENRKMLDVGNDCLLSDDGVDLLLAKKYHKEYYSHKFKKSALRYEIGLCIKTGWICWWNGPFEPGLYNDESIFHKGLVGWLEEGELVETDRGYRGSSPQYIKCPGTVNTHADKKEMQQRVRCRQETVNKRMKQWNILKAAYRHDVDDHQHVFAAVAILTQLAIENGEPLFDVEYDD